MHHTPWTATPSSLPSDRIPVKARHQTPAKAKSSGSSAKPAEQQKSKALRELESLLSAVRNESTSAVPDPKGGCFCQARMHPLSLYVAMCPNCALPLCRLNPPNYACPHCTSSLLPSLNQRAKLVTRLQDEIGKTRAREEAEVIQIQEDARKAAGAFPALQSSTPQPHPKPSRAAAPAPVPQPQQHKVLSLNAKTRRAVLTTTTTRSSPPASTTPSRPASPPLVRVPPPLGADVLFARDRVRPERPWENLILRREGQECVYVPPVKAQEHQGKHRGKGKGKAKETTAQGSGQGT